MHFISNQHSTARIQALTYQSAREVKVFTVPKNKSKTLAVSAAGTHYYLCFTDEVTQSQKHSNKF